MPRILFVEDEVAIQDTLQRFFTREGFEVQTARARSEALELCARQAPDVAVLDVMLNEGPEPEHDGFAVCRALREAGYSGPVIFVTARTSEDDKLTGFDLGADDYVTKPFSVKELKARVSAVLRRAGGVRSVYRYGEVEVDLDNYVIRHGAEAEQLTNREQELLRYLIEHPGKVLPRGELLTGIWRYSPNVTTRTVDTHILNVRKKLRDDASNPSFIETLHGVGYRFIAKER
ncbi:MAG: response regulator transcription factor [Myxococcales bacterium]|nr:response regulator transcription factor [Myxococcales bacterium]MCB9694197.1 response regulator transcription factor [Alphaproteobacteria bacterium]